MGRRTAVATVAIFTFALAAGGWTLLRWTGQRTLRPVVVLPTTVPALSSDTNAQIAPTAARPPAPPGLSSEAQAELTAELQSKSPSLQQDAVGRMRALATTDPRSLALGIPQWVGPMLDAKLFQDAEQLSQAAILERPFDIIVVDAAQRARVLALTGQGQYSSALAEAKGYYNVALLSNTAQAIDLMQQILAKTSSVALAASFKMSQLSGTELAAPSANSDSPPRVELKSDVLQSIDIDAKPYASVLAQLQGRRNGKGEYSHSNLMAQGNLLLLSNRPEEALQCFTDAIKTEKVAGKYLREAVEGVARTIRAQDGNVGRANAFISSLQDISGVAAAFPPSAGFPASTEIEEVAQQTPLASVNMMASPPLEQARVIADSLSGNSATEIRIDSDMECGTPVQAQQVSSTHYALTFTSREGSCMWFMFRIHGGAGKIVRFDLAGPGIVVMNKWWSFNPMYGNFGSLDDDAPFKSEEQAPQASPTVAWNGALLPSTAGQNWHYVPDVWREGVDKLSFVMKLESDSTYVAMRVPYPPSYNERYLRSLTSNPLVNVVEVGQSRQGRPLLLAEIGADADKAAKPCVLLYAGEHADEYDTGWVARGLIEYLLGTDPLVAELRNRVTFLVVPVFDPVTSAIGEHQYLLNHFYVKSETPESMSYANWFQIWVKTGHRLDLVFNLHNVASAESVDVVCPLIEGFGARGKLAWAMHSMLVDRLRVGGFTAALRPWMRGISPDRLGGWLDRFYGASMIAYEINSQASDRHLTMEQLKDIGRIFADSTDAFFATADGKSLLADVDARRTKRLEQWADYSRSAIPNTHDAIRSEAEVIDAASKDDIKMEQLFP
jgi:hypothetical protein